MKVFIQGMRRNGTTILFDLFCEDDAFDCWYEPLAAADKPCIGGGSEEREQDYFEKVRKARAELLRRFPHWGTANIFNWGAPRDGLLELNSDIPGHVKTYLRYLCNQSAETVIKFTRMAHKAAALDRLAPDSYFIHIVRDPRRVVASYIFGKHERHRERYAAEEAFFSRSTNRVGWSIPVFADALLRQRRYAHLGDIPDYMRVLLVWKDCFEATYEAGARLFGKRYLLCRHEDLAGFPLAKIGEIYRFLNRDVPVPVLNWAQKHVVAPKPVFAAGHRGWEEAFEVLDLYKALDLCGYRDLQELPTSSVA